MKKNIKDMNIWSYFKKLTPDEQESEANGTVLYDGFGGAYLVPNVGTTDLYSLDKDTFFYDYNFETKELEAYTKTSDSDYEYVDSISLNVGDFADNPEYWVNNYAEKLQEQGYQEAESVADIIDNDENSENEYNYHYNISLTVDIYYNSDNWDNKVDAEEKYKKYIESLSDDNYYQSEYDNVKIKCDFTDNYIVSIDIYSDMPREKEELVEILNDFETKITDSPESDITNISIENVEMTEI